MPDTQNTEARGSEAIYLLTASAIIQLLARFSFDPSTAAQQSLCVCFRGLEHCACRSFICHDNRDNFLLSAHWHGRVALILRAVGARRLYNGTGVATISVLSVRFNIILAAVILV